MNNSSYLGLAFWSQDRQPVQRADWTSTKKKKNWGDCRSTTLCFSVMISKIIRFLWSLNHAITLGRSLKSFFFILRLINYVLKKGRKKKKKKKYITQIRSAACTLCHQIFFFTLINLTIKMISLKLNRAQHLEKVS